jgi:uncharacterized protein (TIGR00255 family)
MKSMTGFANQTCEFVGGSATLEVRSVNNRGLDLKLRVPDLFASLEPKLRETITKVAKRGSLQVNVRYSLQDDVSDVPAIDEKMTDQVLTGIEQIEDAALARHLSLAPSKASDILGIKGVLAHETGFAELSADISQAVRTAMSAMIDNWDLDRAREGEALARILGDQIDTIADLVTQARAFIPQRKAKLEKGFHDNLKNLSEQFSEVEPERVAQEVALYIIKQDVAEELDRLDAHIEAARSLFAEQTSIGRRAEFLIQEFNREANTLCSKAQHSDLSRIGLELKTTIDQMREQIQNVE